MSKLNVLVEPVGSKGPKFSTDLKLIMFDRFVGQGLGLFCQAQGFPVPSFRYVIDIKEVIMKSPVVWLAHDLFRHVFHVCLVIYFL